MRVPPVTTVIISFTILAITSCLVSRYGLHLPEAQSRFWLIAALMLGGTPFVIELARKALRAEFGSDLLAGTSIVSSALVGEYLAGSVVVLMLSAATPLKSMRRAEPLPFWRHLQRGCLGSRTWKRSSNSWTLM